MAYVSSAIPADADSVLEVSRPQETAASSGDDVANQHVAWMMSQLRGAKNDSHRSLLTLRFILLNVLCFGFLGVAYSMGLIDKIWLSDRTHFSAGIFVVFLGGLGFCGLRVIQTSRDLDALRSFDPMRPSRAATYLALLRGAEGESRALLASSLRLKLSQRISVVRQVANSLVLLGLIGTVIGFVIALSGVDPEQASNVQSIAPMVSTMIDGMSTALYTTLVGAVLNLWLVANHQLLTSGTVKLITGMVEFGELHART